MTTLEDFIRDEIISGVPVEETNEKHIRMVTVALSDIHCSCIFLSSNWMAHIYNVCWDCRHSHNNENWRRFN